MKSLRDSEMRMASRYAWFAAVSVVAASVLGHFLFEGKEPRWLDYGCLFVALLAIAVALACHSPSMARASEEQARNSFNSEQRGEWAEKAAADGRRAKRWWLGGVAISLLTLLAGAFTGFDRGYSWVAYAAGAIGLAAFLISLRFVIEQHIAMRRSDGSTSAE